MGEQYLRENAEWLGFEFHKPNINFDKNVEVHSEPQPQPRLSPSGYIIPDNIPLSQPQQTSNEEPDGFGNDNFCISKPKPITKDKLNLPANRDLLKSQLPKDSLYGRSLDSPGKE